MQLNTECCNDANISTLRGGLGLTTGVCDAGSLVDCLWGIDSGEATMDILDLYDKHRRRIFKDVTDARSTVNLQRLQQKPDGVTETDPFLKMLDAARTDPEVAKQLVEVRA